MNPKTRTILLWIVAVVVVAAVAGGGFLIIDQRAAGSGRALVPDTPVVTTSPQPSASPTMPTPPRKHWLVAVVRRKTAVYEQPVAGGDAIKGYLTPKSRKTGYTADTVLLVRSVKETPQRVWYNVALPAPPNGSRGWVPDRGVTLYPVYTKIVVDLSAHKLTVLDGSGEVQAQFAVGVGTATNPTPTGSFFITAKIKLRDPTGPFGVFALATNAFSATLTDWPDGGQVAIHGTNQPGSVGKSESHGCIRMLNEDIIHLVEQVKAGSPVVIRP